MNTTTSVKCEFEDYPPVELSISADRMTVLLKQDNDTICFPRADVYEFARVLTEWAAGQ